MSNKKFIKDSQYEPYRAALASAFPGCFVPSNSGIKRPLAIGIAKSIMTEQRVAQISEALGSEADRRLIYATIKRYTHGVNYALGMISSEHRYHLDGKTQKKVTYPHKIHAVDFLKRHYERRQKWSMDRMGKEVIRGSDSPEVTLSTTEIQKN